MSEVSWSLRYLNGHDFSKTDLFHCWKLENGTKTYEMSRHIAGIGVIVIEIMWLLRHSNITTAQYSDIPIFWHSNIPTARYSDIPIFRQLDIPLDLYYYFIVSFPTAHIREGKGHVSALSRHRILVTSAIVPSDVFHILIFSYFRLSITCITDVELV